MLFAQKFYRSLKYFFDTGVRMFDCIRKSVKNPKNFHCFFDKDRNKHKVLLYHTITIPDDFKGHNNATNFGTSRNDLLR